MGNEKLGLKAEAFEKIGTAFIEMSQHPRDWKYKAKLGMLKFHNKDCFKGLIFDFDSFNFKRRKKHAINKV